jgi:hypothetical protein
MLSIIFIQILVRLFTGYFVRCCKNDGSIVTVVFWLVNAGWVGYGSFQFYGSDNNCNSVETRELHHIMLGMLISGYAQLGFVVVFAFINLVYNSVSTFKGTNNRALTA